MKNAIAVTGAAGISISQHIGDLDTVEANAAFVRVAADLTRLAVAMGRSQYGQYLLRMIDEEP